MKILIVDDNLENLDLLRLMLVSQKYKVKQALNGKEALDLLRQEDFDLIISDILMPVMDGFQLCRECKRDEKLKSICFVFYTATYIEDKDEEFALSLGAAKFIRKPQEPEEFIRIIKDVIEKNHIIDKEPEREIIHNEKEIYKLYSERLVNKLEKKNLDLQKEIELRKQKEIELIAAKEKAEECDKLKSAFLKNLYHEIRTPMNAIIGFSGLLRDESLAAEKRNRYVDIIQKSGYHLVSIIDDIIEIATIETNQIKLYLSDVNIDNLMEDVYDYFLVNIPTDKQIIFSLKKPVNKYNPVFKTDQSKLRRILSSLLSNAFKFTQEGKIELGYEYNNGFYFYVKDTGIGIDEKYFDLIFERFTRIEDDNTIKTSGSGLGLPIAKAYVELLGGEIKVESKVGEGSKFYFTIPPI